MTAAPKIISIAARCALALLVFAPPILAQEFRAQRTLFDNRQPMILGDTKEKFGTQLWFKDYERRIDALLAIAAQKKAAVLCGWPACFPVAFAFGKFRRLQPTLPQPCRKARRRIRRYMGRFRRRDRKIAMTENSP